MIDDTDELAATWPAGYRAAVCPVILFDAPAVARSGGPAIGLDYAPSGFNRLLSVMADLDLMATVGVTPAAERFAPTLVAKATAMKLDVVGWSSNKESLDSDPEVPDGSLFRGTRGHVAGLPHHPAVTSLPADIAWIIDGSGGDKPTLHGETCLIPTSPYWVDSVWLDPCRPLPPSSLLEAWSLSLAGVRTQGALMTVLLHAELSGRIGISGQIMRFLDEVIESGDVWITSAAQIATWWREEAFNQGQE
jgi:hypothetical protein